MTRTHNISLFALLLLLSPMAHGQMSLDGQKVVGAHPGYLASVEEERHLVVEEMVLINNPNRKEKPLKDRIFDDELSDEFNRQYEQRFGRTPIEQNLNSPNRFTEFQYSQRVRVTVEEDVKQKQKFGEYMVRRLSEHHVDQYAKSSPSFKRVYELKDRISNYKLETKRGYKFRIKYSFSGNYASVRMENPYDIYTNLTMRMEEGGLAPSEITEYILEARYPYSKTITLSTFYRAIEGTLQLTTSKSLGGGMGVSLSGITNSLSDEPVNINNRILVGWYFTQ